MTSDHDPQNTTRCKTPKGTMPTNKKAVVVYLDIETAPTLGWTWGLWEQNVIDTKKPWYILSFAYKFEGEKVQSKGLIDYPGFKKDMEDDSALVKELWDVFDKADIVVAHNGDRFDILRANARFVGLGLNPPSPYKSVDTCKIARRYFKFDSNKLDNLGHYLGLGRKLPNTGFDLWKRCMTGDPQAWKEMIRYNERDVILLEKVYLKLRSWAKTHPSVTQGNGDACPKCNSTHLQKRGFSYTATRKRQRLQCADCGGWLSGQLIKEPKVKEGK